MVGAFSPSPSTGGREPAIRGVRQFRREAHGLTQPDFCRRVGRNLHRHFSRDANVAVVSTGVNGVFSTGDGGNTWTRATLSPAHEDNFGSFIRLRFAPPSAARVYLIEHRFGLLPIPMMPVHPSRGHFDERLGGIAIDPDNADVIYLGRSITGNGLFNPSMAGSRCVASMSRATSGRSPSIPRHAQTSTRAISTEASCARSMEARRGRREYRLAIGASPRGRCRSECPGARVRWVKGGGLFVSRMAAEAGHGGYRRSLRPVGCEAGEQRWSWTRFVAGRVLRRQQRGPAESIR